MDVGAFVQENKRWLVGCAVGGVVYLIANIVIGSIYDADGEQAKAASLLKANRNAELYTAATRDEAAQEAEQLRLERERLQQELAFKPSAKYQLSNQGAPDTYLFQVGRLLKQSILTSAKERDVQVVDREVGWPAVTGVDEIRGVLFGLELLDETSRRLFAAHDKVRSADPEAMGLRTIAQCKTDDRRSQRNPRRTARPGDVDLSDHVVQERVLFQFQADAATLVAFLESCREGGRTLALETIQVLPPQRAGDPLTVKGSLQGIAFKEKP